MDDLDSWYFHQCLARDGTLEMITNAMQRLGADACSQWRSEKGGTALHIAASHDHPFSVFDALVKTGIDVNAKNQHGYTALHYADSKHTIEILLALGARVMVSGQGNYPLHVASLLGNMASARVFVGHPSAWRCLSGVNEFGDTPLDIAVHWDHHDIVDLLRAEEAKWKRWRRRRCATLFGLAAADCVKAVAVAAGKTWAL